MKKTALCLMLFLVALGLMPCFAADRNIRVNRVVVTFSPLIVNNLNCTQKLFNIFAELTSKQSALAKSLEASGALWSISQNLSGIQLSINSSSNKPEELEDIVENLLKAGLPKAEKIVEEGNDNAEAMDRLFLFMVEPERQRVIKTKPVSVSFFDNDGNELVTPVFDLNNLTEQDVEQATNKAETSELPIAQISSSSVEKYWEIYNKAAETNRVNPWIQPVEKPILAKILTWNKFSPANFISANFVKNKILFNPNCNSLLNVEFVNNGTGIVLVIYNEIDNKDLYSQHLEMLKMIDAAMVSPGPKEWQSWSSKLLEVMRNDIRDHNKAAMFNAWLKHWSAEGFEAIPENVQFVTPDSTQEVEIFSDYKQHQFKLSTDCYPAIYACKASHCDNGAYCAVCFEGHDSFIDGIEEYVRSDLQINVPVTIHRKQESSIVLSFFSPNDKIPTHLSKIKATISDLLYSKFKITDLKKSIKIGVSGVSSIPAYQLQGLLISGWTTNTARYESKMVKTEELFDMIQNDSNDENILKTRWNNLTAAPQDKSIVLAILASRNLLIDTWDR